MARNLPTALPAEHRLAPLRHPQTYGMVERFNGHIDELLQRRPGEDFAELFEVIQPSHSQRSFNSKTPTLTLEE